MAASTPASPGSRDAPIAAIVFYRSVVEGGQTAPVMALATALHARQINALPLYVTSLKDRDSADFIVSILSTSPPAVILNATAFAVSSGAGPSAIAFRGLRLPRAAGRLRGLQRGAVARKSARAGPPRSRHECRAAGARRAHSDARRLLQGGGGLA